MEYKTQESAHQAISTMNKSTFHNYITTVEAARNFDPGVKPRPRYLNYPPPPLRYYDDYHRIEYSPTSDEEHPHRVIMIAICTTAMSHPGTMAIVTTDTILIMNKDIDTKHLIFIPRPIFQCVFRHSRNR
jgi:hypothetical protein